MDAAHPFTAVQPRAKARSCSRTSGGQSVQQGGSPSPALQGVSRISSIKWLLAANAGKQASAVNFVIVLARKLRIMPIVSDRPAA
jgi:hypothetical protein